MLKERPDLKQEGNEPIKCGNNKKKMEKREMLVFEGKRREINPHLFLKSNEKFFPHLKLSMDISPHNAIIIFLPKTFQFYT